MGKQEQLICRCDRCTRFVAVTKKNNGGFFLKPEDWKEWDDREGTIVLLCPECDELIREFVKPAKGKQKAG